MASLCVSSVLTKIIKTGYAALQLEYFFTAGPDEVRAWTIRVSAVIMTSFFFITLCSGALTDDGSQRGFSVTDY